jgi:2-oxoglutarate decarboxylase
LAQVGTIEAEMTRLTREEFGPNVWLVEEMYRKYLEDPESVSQTWQEFFADYQPPQDGPRAPAPEQRVPREPGRPPGQPGEPDEPEEEPEEEEEEEPAEPGRPREPVPARAEAGAEPQPLKGVLGVIAQRMEESLGVPTATSFRTIPAKLLEINRTILNRHLARHRGGRISFTHLIGYAITTALKDFPGMNVTFTTTDDGKPAMRRHEHVNLGLAVDVKRDDGTRALLVPSIKEADTLDFKKFHRIYEDLIKKTVSNKLSPDDFAGTTVTVTNPGMIGTVQSVPRLMANQAAIIGVGALDIPAEWKGSDPGTLAEIGIGKVLTLTSTYDHRVIQGAESGEFLRRIEQLLLGESKFYEDVFRSMGVPYVPVEWRADAKPHEGTIERDEQLMRLRHLIQMYRVRGHLIADLDPLAQEPPTLHPELDPATYGFTLWDLDRTFVCDGLAGQKEMKLRDILGVLRDAYCRTATVEYMHIEDSDQKKWIQEQLEGVDATLPHEDRRHIISKLGEVEALEQFLHTKYIGHKRFSLEGGESLIPILDAVLSGAADEGLSESVIGMAHRGRLDVLTSVVGKSYADVFREFEGYVPPDMPQGSGDVKYHIGAEGKFTSPGGNDIRVSVASNPSHLEAVDPVVEGMARAKLDLLGQEENGEAARVLSILIHGDAAFAGQGVVAETLAMSKLTGYRTGGTVHVIVNNQLGFTTGSNYGRSSTYASDVAKMVQAPIWHVNGDDPEACLRAARLAFAFRMRFNKDVVIDMWCYRKWGHNEGDDPSFTQPLMYRKIKDRRSVRKRYLELLVNRGDLSVEEAEESLKEFKERLDRAFEETPREPKDEPPSPIDRRRVSEPSEEPSPVETAVPREKLDRVVEAITTVPEGFHVHKKLAKWLEDRKTALDRDQVDWPFAEQLAWGSLVLEGRTVRLSGQDSRRGTFNQRHSVLVDQETGEEYTPLRALENANGDGRGRFITLDSLLSEFAVVGFEYGYSVASPDALVQWEGQFGDFINEAQVIVDQFIVPGESKWGQPSSLVLLLPHGQEGQGPEHSSARLERFLELCAEDNMVVAVPSTPAQYFHLLRRQALRERKKPLVVATPKSPLRAKEVRSAAAEFTGGRWEPVLDDLKRPDETKRVVLCQGKFYWDLRRGREEKSAPVALVRVEQLYPFPEKELKEVLDGYSGAEVVWAQEEPENMGPWRFLERELRRTGLEPKVVAREPSPSPATGSLTIYNRQQQELLKRSFS